jgi:NDP-sugar pyrophosphorylase family protein
MRKVCFELLPHGLKIARKAARVAISRELFDFLEGRTDQNLYQAYISDDMWACVDNARTFMWIQTDLERMQLALPIADENTKILQIPIFIYSSTKVRDACQFE